MKLFSWFMMLALMLITIGCAHEHPELSGQIDVQRTAISQLENKVSDLENRLVTLENSQNGKTAMELTNARDQGLADLQSIRSTKSNSNDVYQDILSTQSQVNADASAVKYKVDQASSLVNDLIANPTVDRLTKRLDYFETNFEQMRQAANIAEQSAQNAANSAENAEGSAYAAAQDAQFAAFIKSRIESIEHDINRLRERLKNIRQDNKSDLRNIKNDIDRLERRINNVKNNDNNERSNDERGERASDNDNDRSDRNRDRNNGSGNRRGNRRSNNDN